MSVKKKKKSKGPVAFVVAGTSSSSGKTVITLGIMEALRKKGLVVQPFKAGPDFIDPGHHTMLLKRPSYNLDTWMMGTEGVERSFYSHLEGADAAVIEGVMGLYDGKGGGRGREEEGSTAHLAKVLGLPVVLVVNAEKMARSAAAVVKGFALFDPKVDIRWVVFNKVASPIHAGMLRDSIPRNSKVKVLGFIPRDPALVMPGRHLGLVTSEDLDKRKWNRFVKKAGALAAEYLNLKEFLSKSMRIERDSKDVWSSAPGSRTETSRAVARIAVARDAAFSFCYEENLEIMKASGATLVFFSPLMSDKLPRGVSGVYLGGGYPELYAAALDANTSLKNELRLRARAGLPVLAECGGLMYFGKRLVDEDGRNHEMVGLFPWKTRMRKTRKALGYREVKLTRGCPFLRRGKLRGHEFHYSDFATAVPEKIERVFKLGASKSNWEASEGFRYKNTLASYVHIHFASNPRFAAGFVNLCAQAPEVLPVDRKG